MKPLSIVSVLALAALSSARASEATSARASVGDVIKAYEAALNRNGTDGILSLYGSDPIFMPQNSEALVGRDAVRAGYERVFATIKLNIRFEIHEVPAEWQLGVGSDELQRTDANLGQWGRDAGRQQRVVRRSQGRRDLEDPPVPVCNESSAASSRDKWKLITQGDGFAAEATVNRKDLGLTCNDFLKSGEGTESRKKLICRHVRSYFRSCSESDLDAADQRSRSFVRRRTDRCSVRLSSLRPNTRAATLSQTFLSAQR